MSEKSKEPYERMTDEVFDSFETESFREPTASESRQRQRPRPAGTSGNMDERTWSMIAHLSGLAGYIIPFGSVLGPLVVWLTQRDSMPAVGEHARQALNFQLTLMIGFLISFLLAFVFIGIPMMIALGISQLVFTIIAAVKVSQGEAYQYPFSMELVKPAA